MSTAASRSSGVVASIESNRERLLNLIDLQLLKPELSGRPVLQPFLHTIKATSGSNEKDVEKLLQFICDPGQPKAAGDALIEALAAEEKHPGHQDAFKIIKESMDRSTASETDFNYEKNMTDVLMDCMTDFEQRLDFNSLMPQFLQRGLLTMDQFTSLLQPFVSPKEKASSLIKITSARGVKGITDLINALENTSNESHTGVAIQIKDKVHKIIVKEGSGTLSDEHQSLLSSVGILINPSDNIPTTTAGGKSTNTISSSIVPIKRDRIAVLISMDTYYDASDVIHRVPARLSNGQLVSERTKELQRLFEDLGCTVVSITDIKEDVTDPLTMRNIFSSKIMGLCSKNTVVFVCLLGMVYVIKDKGHDDGMGLLLKDKVALPVRLQCILEQHLAAAVVSLPTPYVTVIVEGIHNKHTLEVCSINPWQSLCPLNSRVVVLYTELSPDVVNGKEKMDQDLLGTGSLTEIILKLLRELNKRGSLSNKGISYQKLFIMINALWDPLYHTIPCVKGDIDRDMFATTNHPIPYHVMGTVLSSSLVRSVYLITAGLPLEYCKGTEVKICHVFRPDLIFDGVVEDSSDCTATVSVSDVQQWKDTLEDTAKGFLEGAGDHGTFVYVYKIPSGRMFCVDVQVSEANQGEMSMFLKESCVFESSSRDNGSNILVMMKETDHGEFHVTSTNVNNTNRVTSLQLAKSLFMRVAINERVRQIKNNLNTEVPNCHCYIHPLKAMDLLSKEQLQEKSFTIKGSRSHVECEVENAVCRFEDTRFWSPLINEPIFLSVEFPRNIYLKEVEVRGSITSPNSIPYGYNISYLSMLRLPKTRYNTSPLKTKGGMAIKLQYIREWDQDDVTLSNCEGPFTLTINPLLSPINKRVKIAMKLLCLAENGNEKPMLTYQLQHGQYINTGFSFNYPPSQEGIINLPRPDEWLIIEYPVVARFDIILLIPDGVTVTQLLLNSIQLKPDSEFTPPDMIELYLHRLRRNLAMIQCFSCFPEQLKLPLVLPCNQVLFHPVPNPNLNPNPSNGSRFNNPICLQVQLRGFNDLTEIKVHENDLLECVITYSAVHAIYFVVFCLEDTGSIDIVHHQKLSPKEQSCVNLIKAYIPNGLTSDVHDEYMIMVSSCPIHLTSLQQVGGVNYYSGIKYSNKLLKPVSKITGDDAKEWSMMYRYKVKVKTRQKIN